ncbi:transposase [Propioniciclava sinopodophylli]|uniref:transposase n=1 Tax=Propioniciclava sinopodophylli TaxID=1837344 RepID=UPI0019D517E6
MSEDAPVNVGASGWPSDARAYLGVRRPSPRRSGRHDQIAKLGRTLKQWRDAFLAYFDTGRASNGGTESINGLIELHRRIARGFRNRDNYQLRMLLIGGGLGLTPFRRSGRYASRPVARGGGQGDWSDHDEQ